MGSPIGHARNTRSLFNGAHDAGKGDVPRDVDREKFESNYEEIRWTDEHGTSRVKRIIKLPRKTVYIYK
jgi:hypothetical protein